MSAIKKALQKGISALNQRKFAAAERVFKEVLRSEPNHVGALNLLTVVLMSTDRFAEAEPFIARAISLGQASDASHYNFGLILKRLNKPTQALQQFSEALRINPAVPDAWNSRGTVFNDLAQYKEAIFDFDQAILLNPDYSGALANKGKSLAALKRYDEAYAMYEKALALKPDLVEAWLGRGIVFAGFKRFDEAFAAYDKAFALKPDLAEAWLGRGNMFRGLKRFDEAFASYNQALALKPDYAEAFYGRGSASMDSGKWAEAVVDYERAIALKRDYPEARLALCVAQLPVLYTEDREIAERRAAYQQQLEALDVDQRRRGCDWANAVGSTQPFFLAYQGCNDRDLQRAYGSLVCGIMAERYPPPPLSPPPRSDERIRLGIVSGFFRRHSNWKIPIRGWLSQIDRRQFQLFGYHTGVDNDAETQLAAGMCDQFVQGPFSVDRWREIILTNAPHVLIYPEVGMHPVSVQLAARRLAP